MRVRACVCAVGRLCARARGWARVCVGRRSVCAHTRTYQRAAAAEDLPPPAVEAHVRDPANVEHIAVTLAAAVVVRDAAVGDAPVLCVPRVHARLYATRARIPRRSRGRSARIPRRTNAATSGTALVSSRDSISRARAAPRVHAHLTSSRAATSTRAARWCPPKSAAIRVDPSTVS